MLQNCDNAESNVIVLTEVQQVFPRIIPSVHRLTPTRLELHSKGTIVLHWSSAVEGHLLPRIAIMNCLVNKAANKQYESINSSATWNGFADEKPQSCTTCLWRPIIGDGEDECIWLPTYIRLWSSVELGKGIDILQEWKLQSTRRELSNSKIFLRRAAALSKKMESAKK